MILVIWPQLNLLMTLNIVNEYMKVSGYSVGISDLIADNETYEKIVTNITNKKNEVKVL